jgi:hypothetical protein
MAFWNSAASEPKRQHRFLIYMNLGTVENAAVAAGTTDKRGPAAATGFVPYLAKSFTKPSFEVSETEHKFLGNTYYYPGTLTWNECECVIINSVAPDGQELLLRALKTSGYVFPNEQADGKNDGTINKEASLTALGEVKIEELNGAGEVLNIWILNNAFIKSVNFGDLDYSGDDLLNITIGMRYDWASYQGGAGNVTTSVFGKAGTPAAGS